MVNDEVERRGKGLVPGDGCSWRCDARLTLVGPEIEGRYEEGLLLAKLLLSSLLSSHLIGQDHGDLITPQTPADNDDPHCAWEATNAKYRVQCGSISRGSCSYD